MPADKPSAPRVAALRERRAALGLVRLELWARPEHHAAIRGYAAALQPNLESFGPATKLPPTDGPAGNSSTDEP